MLLRHIKKSGTIIGNKFFLRCLCETKQTDSDNNKKTDTEKKDTNDQALKKLNALLDDMIKPDKGKILDLAKPRQRQIKLKKELQEEEEVKKKETIEQKIIHAVKDVAQSIGGNTNKTESELLMRLLTHTEKETDTEQKSDGTSEQVSLGDLLGQMKVDNDKSGSLSRPEQVRQLLAQATSRSQNSSHTQRYSRTSQVMRTPVDPERMDLFSGRPLGILKKSDERQGEDKAKITKLKTWEMLYQRELKLSVTHPPSNYYQQMILWTEQGKLWKFPIDNEQGMDEEKNVPFTDHVFLEHHLDSWCPEKGPIRHFMELVCVGLSKNYYLSIHEKRDHIDWFKNYFENKRALLEEVGAFPVNQNKIETEKSSE